jgi:VWFA-related protein
MRRITVALVGAILLSSVLLAQLKVDVALVNVVATVTDEKGRYVEGLTKDDFILQEDGQNQTISHLTQSNDLPVSVGVTLDTSGSMERKISTATNAVERFIRTIHEDDDIFLLTFSDRPILRQDFTADRDRLAAALRRVTVGGGTALYDALEESLTKIKSGLHDKKAILLITDGEDTSSRLTYDEALLAVRESELLVYCVGISPASYTMSEDYPPTTPPTMPGPSGGPSGRRNPPTRGGGGGIGIPFPNGLPFPFPIPGRRPYALELQRPQRPNVSINRDSVDMDILRGFADASGAKAWLLSGNWADGRGNQVEQILDEIASELRNQYSIGYYPTHPLQDGKWHRIAIKTKNSRYFVRARKEYFGK